MILLLLYTFSYVNGAPHGAARRRGGSRAGCGRYRSVQPTPRPALSGTSWLPGSRAHGPERFCVCGDHRFDPPPDGRELFGTCYLAGYAVGAFIEKFADLGIVTRERVDAHRLAHLQVPATRLADVTDRRALRWGVTGELGTGGDYSGTQAWAERLFQAGFGGIWYTAKHDPRGDLHSIALFGKPGFHQEAFVSSWSEPISDELVDDVTARFDIQVLPATSL